MFFFVYLNTRQLGAEDSQQRIHTLLPNPGHVDDFVGVSRHGE
jgi:hypothetical protein